MSYFGIVSLCNGLFALFAGLYVFFKNWKNPVYVSFSGFAITVALWAILYAIWQFQTSRPLAFFFVRLLMVPCYYIPSAFFWFVLRITEDDRRMRYLPTCVVIPTFFLLFSFSGLMVKDVVPRLYFLYWPVPGLFMHVFVIFFFALVCYAYYLLIRAWLRASGMRRWQLKWVTLTTLGAWSGGSTNWFLWYNIPIPPVPNIFVAVVFLLLAYAIMRRQLFDVDTLADYVQEAKLSALGTLAAGLLHEIRNPLFVAQGFAESLLSNVKGGLLDRLSKEERDKKCQDKLEKIISQIGRVVEISRRFSEFAKPEAQSRALEAVNLNETVDDVLSLMSYELQLDRIQVEKQVNPDTAFLVDRRHLEEILLNLMTNACQAMPKGGSLRIRDEQRNGRIHISVSDTGDGISADRLKRIFDPFFSTKEEKGMGLGLYIVKKLVERNGGKIRVATEVGKGTTFSLEFAAG